MSKAPYPGESEDSSGQGSPYSTWARFFFFLASKVVPALHLKTKFLAVTYSCDCCDPGGQEGAWLVVVPS